MQRKSYYYSTFTLISETKTEMNPYHLLYFLFYSFTAILMALSDYTVSNSSMTNKQKNEKDVEGNTHGIF
jgi:hypothetical protein